MFDHTIEITKRENLFGRDKLLNNIIRRIENNTSLIMYGPRRFGKTSVLRVLYNELKSKDTMLPTFIDTREDLQKECGSTALYKYFIAKLIADNQKEMKMILPDLIDSKVLEMNYTYPREWNEIYNALNCDNVVAIKSLFRRIVSEASNLLERKVVFIIDEYEHLIIKVCIDEPEEFANTFRGLVSKPIGESKTTIFTFILTGAKSLTTLNKHRKAIGSPPLNITGSDMSCNILDNDSFDIFWEKEISELAPPLAMLNNIDQIRNITGSCPFFAKVLGMHCMENGELPSWFIFNTHFNSWMDDFTVEQKKILSLIINDEGTDNQTGTTHFSDLYHLGVIDEFDKKNKYYIVNHFFKNYLDAKKREKISNEKNKSKEVNVPKEITNLISNINEHVNGHIFKPGDERGRNIIALGEKCINEESFGDIALAAYKILVESTKSNAGQNRGRLPPAYQKKPEIKNISSLRHYYKAHDKDRLTNLQVPKVQLMKNIFGNEKKRPTNAEDFDKMGKYVITEMKNFLKKLLEYYKV